MLIQFADGTDFLRLQDDFNELDNRAKINKMSYST